MDINYQVKIERTGHTFEVGVGAETYCYAHVPAAYYCRIDGDKEVDCRGIFVEGLLFENSVPLTTADGETKNFGGLKLEADQVEKLEKAFEDYVADYRREMERKARAGEDNLTFAIELDLHDDNPAIIIAECNPERTEADRCSKYQRISLKNMTRRDLPKNREELDGLAFIAYKLSPDEADAYIAENARREAERKEAERIEKEKYEAEKAELLSHVDDWKVTHKKVVDEGGSTEEILHTFKIGGRTLRYAERNVFDFGVVINPEYSVVPGTEGGLLSYKNGEPVWLDFISQSGWEKVRDLDADEKICVTIIKKYGVFVDAKIRM